MKVIGFCVSACQYIRQQLLQTTTPQSSIKLNITCMTLYTKTRRGNWPTTTTIITNRNLVAIPNACFRMQMFKVSLCLAFFFFQYVLHTYANSFLSFQDREGISSYWLHQQVCKKIKINNSFHVNGNSLPAILLFIYFHNNTNVL